MQFIYENHSHPDPLLPLYFHDFSMEPHQFNPFLHWHESVEIIYIHRGSVRILSNTVQIPATVGDIVIINANHIHTFITSDEDCGYYYLIADKDFCKTFGIDVTEIIFQSKLKDPIIQSYFLQLANEMSQKESLYQAIIKSIVIKLFVRLYRNYRLQSSNEHPSVSTMRKLDTVKTAIQFIGRNYAIPLTIDSICAEIGFSKFYFCRMFKAIAGQTVFEYINFVRCMHAKILLTSGKYNVSEAALRCGFSNLSYFTKQYKKYIGLLPSEDCIQKPPCK